jgi:hypothetical protein
MNENYKETDTEFEIQSATFVKLREILPADKYIVRGEYKFSNSTGRGARVDVAIFEVVPNSDPLLVCVVEVVKDRLGKLDYCMSIRKGSCNSYNIAV